MGSVKHLMMEEYENMTSVEQSIADFFIKNEEYMDFSARNISRILYISNATLSRFAKKCGYKGYRELVFDYEKELQEQINEDSISELAKKVKCTYGGLLEEVFQQLDEETITEAIRIAKSRGAGVVLITANREAEIDCDVVLYTATSRNLDQGIAISPQFPILVLTDIFYGYYFKNDTKIKRQRYHMTLETLNKKKS